MKKIALIIAAIVLVSLALVFCVSADSAWDGNVATKFAGGNGTEGNPYQISNAAEWAYFSEFAPSNPGKFYKLTADITFNTGDATTWGESFSGIDTTPYIVGAWYTPDGDPVIGNAGVSNAPFIGTFDGAGHTISGFYAKKTKADGDTVALFGSTAYGATATIKNLLITNSYFESAEGVAAACVGQAEGGTTTIKSVYVTDSVRIVAGKNSKDSSSYAGGIMGHLGQGKFSMPSVVIDSCVNAAIVKGDGTSVAGILGNGNQKIVTITNCLNMGDISGSKYVGGMIGFGKGDADGSVILISSCVNTGKITSSSVTCAIAWLGDTERDTLTVEDSYYVKGKASYGVYEGKKEGEGATGVTLNELCGTKLPSNLNASAWTARGNDKVSPKTFEICVPKAVASFAPQSKLYKVDNLPAWLAKYSSTSTFEIDSVEKFKEIANFVNGEYTESGDFEGKTVKLTADLDFNKADMTEFMIGNMASPFAGTFDGQGHTISGFYVNKNDGSDTAGIFGSTAGGKLATIKNLVIKDSYFKSNGAVGALIGQTSGGSTNVSCVYVDADVVIESTGAYAGGLVGHIGQNGYNFIDGKPAITIDSCVNAANVTAPSEKGGTSVGGILGNGNKKNVTISNCLNMGNVSGYQYVSGILGYGVGDGKNSTLISSCINVGIVKTAYASNVNNLGKACAIVCFGDTARDNLKAENCFYVLGSGLYGVYEKGDGEGADAAKNGSEFIGTNVSNFIAKKFPSWTLREGQIMIPTAIVEIAPVSTYAGGEIETEPAPETDPTPETEKKPETEKPADETKKPVETNAPAASGGCGGFTAIAAAILVAVAGFSTAIVIKQR